MSETKPEYDIKKEIINTRRAFYAQNKMFPITMLFGKQQLEAIVDDVLVMYLMDTPSNPTLLSWGILGNLGRMRIYVCEVGSFIAAYSTFKAAITQQNMSGVFDLYSVFKDFELPAVKHTAELSEALKSFKEELDSSTATEIEQTRFAEFIRNSHNQSKDGFYDQNSMLKRRLADKNTIHARELAERQRRHDELEKERSGNTQNKN